MVSIVLLVLSADTAVVHMLIAQIGSFGYFGALITGVFSVSVFTAAPAYVVLVHLAQEFNPIFIALFGAVGGMVGDFVLFRFIKGGLYREWRPWIVRISRSAIGRLFRSRHLRWLSPAVGAAIIASPLPDEFGVGLMGLSHLKSWQFALITFALNALGIYAVVALSIHFTA
jgi:hypothetical protein